MFSLDFLQRQAGPMCVASRASIPERSEMWRRYRAAGWCITSSWIDDAAGGARADDPTRLWDRVAAEIASATKLVLYAEAGDFPLKGALVEVGLALGLDKPVAVCLPNIDFDEHTWRPVGSWLAHRNVRVFDLVFDAVAWAAPR